MVLSFFKKKPERFNAEISVLRVTTLTKWIGLRFYAVSMLGARSTFVTACPPRVDDAEACLRYRAVRLWKVKFE